jgi:hypothetical protein
VCKYKKDLRRLFITHTQWDRGAVAIYAPLTKDTLGPPLPAVPLLALPLGPLRFHHASASLPAVMERIQAGTGAGPIAGLGDGTFVVTLQIVYVGLMIIVKLFKA